MENTDQQFESTFAAEPLELRPAKPVNLALTLGLCMGGWLVPGMGHVLLGRWIRGLIFTLCVFAMFLMGIAMQGKLYGLDFEEPLHIFAFLANIGIGLSYFVAEQFGLGIGTITSGTYDYGTTFLWVSGLLNYLIVLDAFDIARGRKP